MNTSIKNAIIWQKNAIRRAEGRLRRAENDNDRDAANADIARYQSNIQQLEGKAR